ncbi:calcium-binding protein [Aquicoccus sp. SU-CL01552]|uniref:calcium-binding protein n=1 Tax=Aquicoccus sp. SU-CL01552 TaxID=3127656 RepID=UPI003106EFA4
MTSMISIDASALSGYNSLTFFDDYFDDFVGASMSFYGGAADSAYGATYYMNGSQVLATLETAGETEDENIETDYVVLLEGADLAYDFIHYGASYGHGISGTINSITFGTWVDGQTTGDQAAGEDGEISELEEFLVIDGLDLDAEAGTAYGTGTNLVYNMYKAVQNADAASVEDLLSDYGFDMTGSASEDYLVGTGNDDVLAGRLGRDTLVGKGGDDLLKGNWNDDHLKGQAGDDTLRGGKGDDLVKGGSGDDMLYGGAGDDTLHGGKGDDVLKGRSGDDTLRGGKGDDLIKGGIGNDTVYGGAGEDRFVFGKTAGSDVIADFTPGEDIIKVTALDISGLDNFAISDGETGVVLTSGSVSIELTNVAEEDLSADMFLF